MCNKSEHKIKLIVIIEIKESIRCYTNDANQLKFECFDNGMPQFINCTTHMSLVAIIHLFVWRKEEKIVTLQ